MSTVIEIELPWVGARREDVAPLLKKHRVPRVLDGKRVIVVCGGCVDASESYLDELVRELLVDRHAAEVALLGTDAAFLADCRVAGARYGVADRIHLRRAIEVGA